MAYYTHRIFLLLVFLLIISSLKSSNQEKFSHYLVAGFHLGATTPIPIPREVRKISGYWPQPNFQIGYNFLWKFSSKWFLNSGATLDAKGMGVIDNVKYMYTDVIMDGNNIKGYFTGKNETIVKATYITVPLRVAYKISTSWKLRGGAYVSYRYSSEFRGTVWDGYLRETSQDELINSPKIEIPNKNQATFNFSKDMREFDMGVSFGFARRFSKSRYEVFCDGNYGLMPIFKSNFTGINYTMRNLYFVAGFNYQL